MSNRGISLVDVRRRAAGSVAIGSARGTQQRQTHAGHPTPSGRRPVG
jgi:hypothetical protein